MVLDIKCAFLDKFQIYVGEIQVWQEQSKNLKSPETKIDNLDLYVGYLALCQVELEWYSLF